MNGHFMNVIDRCIVDNSGQDFWVTVCLKGSAWMGMSGQITLFKNVQLLFGNQTDFFLYYNRGIF